MFRKLVIISCKSHDKISFWLIPHLDSPSKKIHADKFLKSSNNTNFAAIINSLVTTYTFDKLRSTLVQTSRRFGHTSLTYLKCPGKDAEIYKVAIYKIYKLLL